MLALNTNTQLNIATDLQGQFWNLFILILRTKTYLITKYTDLSL